MDKLRSLEYVIAAAEEGSFSAAARRLDVTIPAVAKMVNALEHDLGVKLFERSARGLALTTSGEAYLAQCQPALEMLAEADEHVRAAATRVRGPLVVGVQHLIAKSVLADALPGFHARYPEIELDLRNNTQATAEEDIRSIDVFLSLTWPDMPDMIHRRIGTSRFLVCAAPDYWARHGQPSHPRDLERHDCLSIRTQRGAVMDEWNFARGSEKVSVTTRGWLVVSNVHRDSAINLALAGEGVVRILDFTIAPELASGKLVPALVDWESLENPPVSLSYWPSRRRVARVRAFVDFATDVFREVDAGRLSAISPSPAPRWARATHGRVSNIVRRARS
jgi:DNA-binding transcriptional LysR family regulator